MNSNRSMAAACLSAALLVGGMGLLGSKTVDTARAVEPPKVVEKGPHPKLREADRALADAEDYIKEAKDEDFHGHREILLKRINEARTEISLAVQGKKE